MEQQKINIDNAVLNAYKQMGDIQATLGFMHEQMKRLHMENQALQKEINELKKAKEPVPEK